MNIISKTKAVTDGVGQTALVILTALCFAMVASSIGFLFYDVAASYFGWGQWIEKYANIGDVSATGLSLLVSALFTVYQILWWMAKMTSFEVITEYRVMAWLYWTFATLDTIADVAQMAGPGYTLAGIAVNATLVLVIFGALSEVFFAFFAPVSWTLARMILANLDTSAGAPFAIPDKRGDSRQSQDRRGGGQRQATRDGDSRQSQDRRGGGQRQATRDGDSRQSQDRRGGGQRQATRGGGNG